MNRHVCVACLMAISFGSHCAAMASQQSGGNDKNVVPDGVTVHRDLAYVENGHQRQVLDLYVPKSASVPQPLIVWVHGGGWQNGSKDRCPPVRKGFIRDGYAIASINYRLSGHAPFPAQIEDCKAAIRWLKAHADQFQIDADRIGIWGSSAGGHLVALLGTTGAADVFSTADSSEQSSRVQAVCDFYGPTDFKVFVTTNGYERHASEDSPEARLIGGPVLDNPDKAKAVNPIKYISKDVPPFLIVHGDQDRTVPLNQSQLLFDALKRNESYVQFHTIHGAGHGGAGFSETEVDDMVRDFFSMALKPSSGEQIRVRAFQTESTVAADASRRPEGNRSRLTFDRILQQQDEDNDGEISRQEFRGGEGLFRRLDINKDQRVTRDEHERLFGKP